jgi:superfamily II DNA helicase RecQ
VLAEKLSDAGTTAMYYHADMEPGSRAAAHSGWSEGHVKVSEVPLCCIGWARVLGDSVSDHACCE